MFGGRLTIAQAHQDHWCESSETLFYQAINGDSVPIIDADGGLAHVSFLSDPTDAMQSYSVSGLTTGKEYDVWATAVDGAAVIGLLEWSPAQVFGVGVYGHGAYGHRPYPAMLDTTFRGIPVNSAEVVLRLDGGDTLSIDSHRATFLGSIRVSDDAAVIRCHKSYGERREWGVWNAHNQKQVKLKGGANKPFDLGELSAPGICSPTWAPWNEDSDAFLHVFTGRRETVDCHYHHNAWLQSFVGNDKTAVISGAVGFGRTGGFDTSSHEHISSDDPPGFWFQRDIENNSAGAYIAEGSNQCARYIHPGHAGAVKVWGLVWTQNIDPSTRPTEGAAYISMWGQENRMLLTAEWMG